MECDTGSDKIDLKMVSYFFTGTSKNVDTVELALVTTSIKQHLVLCDLRFYFPSQCISYQ